MWPDVYVSGALTGVKSPAEQKSFYEKIGAVCIRHGLKVHVPHQHTDPLEHPGISPADVYRKDHDMVANARIVVAYVGVPSTGVGTELEIARSNGVRVVILYERGKDVSRMARGNPSVVKEIAYSSEEEALEELERYISSGANISKE